MRVQIASGRTYQWIVRETNEDPIIRTSVVGDNETGILGKNMYKVEYADLTERILKEHERILAKKALDKGWRVFADSMVMVAVRPDDLVHF